jgi:glycolate oxidase iron-sulfur subunit
MQTQLTASLAASPAGQAAAQLLGKCVHCGFCNATCPTYQLLGDELDGPRGRIYLIKQVLEGEAPTASTQLHLDRCLSCRACETACPSGVEYTRLLDIGRQLVEEAVPRPLSQRTQRRLLAGALTSRLFPGLLHIARWLRPVLPAVLGRLVPGRESAGQRPKQRHAQRVLLLAGCVQPSMAPNTNTALARVFSAVGIQVEVIARTGCCGAIRHHLNDQSGALDEARRNIDAWWPHVEAGATAIVVAASGCGSMLREYEHLLRLEPTYAQRAARIAAMVRDPVELIAPLAAKLQQQLTPPMQQRVVFHPPCSQQHGLKIRGVVESVLTTLGADLLPFADGHLCCGSAGTYSILQPEIATRLRDAKVNALSAPGPQAVLSANIGCIRHLAAGTPLPVRHWIEWVDERLAVGTV